MIKMVLCVCVCVRVCVYIERDDTREGGNKDPKTGDIQNNESAVSVISVQIIPLTTYPKIYF